MQGEMRATKTYAATEARAKFSDIFDEAFFGERVIVTKRDRKVAIVSMALLKRIDRLLEIEAELEAKEAQAALEEFQSEGGKTLEQIKQELEMD